MSSPPMLCMVWPERARELQVRDNAERREQPHVNNSQKNLIYLRKTFLGPLEDPDKVLAFIF